MTAGTYLFMSGAEFYFTLRAENDSFSGDTFLRARTTRWTGWV